MKLDKQRTLKIIKAALKEDIGARDITTSVTVPKLESVKASIVARENCILCGMDVAEWTINSVDHSVRFKPQVKDGQHVYKGKEIAFLEGHARAILSAERTMLNFLGLLSGIATNVNKFVEKTRKRPVKIYDTRKTLPLLRYLEKYAVTVGGGFNHRFGLWDQALIKENHLKIDKKGARKNIISKLREKIAKNIKIEIEVENLREFKAVLKQRPDIIMLDNMRVKDVKKAVGIRNKLASENTPILEVSGGININNVEQYAGTGVDRISIGALTDSVECVDMSLEIVY
ncbi:MAG: carboxylating nicotinate-nucleotide diphosphorylase [Candidatus Omnitrophota bacterium]|nr:MAG: carboxylating nicotinate-nucleotide diphosphorylase [Candidatus Omnitrophota bacterium]